MSRLRPHLTYANVIATVALFLVLGGGAAYGASQLAKNSVGAKQLKANSVTGTKVKNGSLAATDFKPGQIPAGPVGPRGAEGARGLPGAPGASAVVVRWGFEGKPKKEENGLSYAACKADETLTGGGYDFVEEEGPEGPAQFEFFVEADRPSLEIESEGSTQWPAPADGSEAEGWLTEIENETGRTIHFHAYALCARP